MRRDTEREMGVGDGQGRKRRRVIEEWREIKEWEGERREAN
jgi:hypothetical protein